MTTDATGIPRGGFARDDQGGFTLFSLTAFVAAIIISGIAVDGGFAAV